MKRWIWILPTVAVLLIVWFLSRPGNGVDGTLRTLRVTRGTVTRNATAVGRIEVEHEVPVKSPTGGILTKLFVELGERVEPGQPLAEVRPVATELTFLEAERALEAAERGEETAREYLELRHPAAWFSRLMLGAKNLERVHEGAAEARERAAEQLRLLREGEVEVESRRVDYIVRAPVAGHVIDIRQREGAPVVPSSFYGSGSVFMTLADMGRLLFRGSVDEIDVGRLREGMPTSVKVGALPGLAVEGKLSEIALKGHERNNAVVFGVRIEIQPPDGTVLRSGYSAVAEIAIDRRDDVLVLPERAVEFRDESAFVQIPDGRGGTAETKIETGLSDGLTVEVVGGLAEGQEVLERVYE